MPAYTRGQRRSQFVFCLVNDVMYFGFKPKDISGISGISEADVTPLGHVAPGNTTDGRLIIIGANSPKPPRVSKKIGTPTIDRQLSVSTYCAYNAIIPATQQGWKLTKQRQTVLLRSPGTQRSMTAIAQLSGGYLYCFPMNKADFLAYGGTMGLRDSTTINNELERNKLVLGSSNPQPGRCAKRLENGSIFSSFFTTSRQQQLINDGFDILTEEKIIPVAQVPF